MQRLDDEVENLLEYYIGGSYFGFVNTPIPLLHLRLLNLVMYETPKNFWKIKLK